MGAVCAPLDGVLGSGYGMKLTLTPKKFLGKRRQ